MHSLKKLFDVGLVGLTAVVFGRERFGAAGQQKPPVAAVQRAVWMAGQDMAAPGHITTYRRTEEGVEKDGRS